MVAHVGPYSRLGPLARVDGRTKEGRFLKAVREDLTEHIGRPSVIERGLIERVAWLSLRLAQLDARMVDVDRFSQHDHRFYLAWSNSLARTLRDLGLKAAEDAVPSLAEHLAYRAAERVVV